MKRKSTTAKALSKKQFLNLSPEQMFAAYSAERQAKAEAEERAEREKSRADKAETIISTIRRLHAEATSSALISPDRPGSVMEMSMKSSASKSLIW